MSATPAPHPLSGTLLDGWSEDEVTRLNSAHRLRLCPNHDAPLVADYAANEWVCPRDDMKMRLDDANVVAGLHASGFCLDGWDNSENPMILLRNASFPNSLATKPWWLRAAWPVMLVLGAAMLVAALKGASSSVVLVIAVLYGVCALVEAIGSRHYTRSAWKRAKEGVRTAPGVRVPDGMIWDGDREHTSPDDLVGMPGTNLIVPRRAIPAELTLWSAPSIKDLLLSSRRHPLV